MTAKWQYKEAYEAALVTARELRSEKAKLREGYDSLAQEHVQTIVELSNAYREEDRLKAENSKLRELVRDMWPHVRHRSRMCSECELPCATSDECLLYEPMRQRMRELGVEVSDD